MSVQETDLFCMKSQCGLMASCVVLMMLYDIRTHRIFLTFSIVYIEM